MRVTIVAARGPIFGLAETFDAQPSTREPSTMAEPPTVGYNVCMSIEEDESPSINEQQPREAEDQFDEDLMRELERRQFSPSR